MSSGRTIEVIPEEGDDILGLSVAFFVSGGEGKVDDHWCLYLGDIAGCLVSGCNTAKWWCDGRWPSLMLEKGRYVSNLSEWW